MSLAQLSGLLPLPEDELKQVLDYAATLSKSEAADHFGNMLGDSPQAVDFIASFNSRRQDPKAKAPHPAADPSTTPSATSSSSSRIEAVPKTSRGGRKKKANIHTLAPRQVENVGPMPGTVYNKKNLDDDYMPRKSSPANAAGPASASATPPPSKSATPPPPPKAPPSAAGQLISDAISGPGKSKSKSTPASRTGSRSSTPAPKTKINISGGTAMHGASTAMSDLDAAIRALEITTNPTKSGDDAARRCNCVATRHPLLAAAPNCLNCGKVICIKEGLGPCTFCGTPLLSPSEVQSMIKELRSERGREKQAADREAHRKPDVSRTPAPFSSRQREAASDAGPSEAEQKALQQRDRLLGFQAQNARRTTVRDEAADFDVGNGMGNMWATPEERARELKRQQKLMREMEWNARPDYEKRQQVVSIDLVGGKVVRKMAAVERPQTPPEEDTAPVLKETSGNRGGSGGTFSRNPLLKGMIKPVFDAKGKGAELEGRKDRATRWRRVQDDQDDNEGVILDGGAYGGRDLEPEVVNVHSDEPNCG